MIFDESGWINLLLWVCLRIIDLSLKIGQLYSNLRSEERMIQMTGKCVIQNNGKGSLPKGWIIQHTILLLRELLFQGNLFYYCGNWANLSEYNFYDETKNNEDKEEPKILT